MIAFDVKGIDHVSNNLRRLAESLPIVASQALNEVAEETMTDAKNRTPVDSGTLKRSGKVSKHASAGSLSAELSFATEYAIYVHERTELRHKVGECKFLERALAQTARWFETRLAHELFGRMQTGAGSPGGVGNL